MISPTASRFAVAAAAVATAWTASWSWGGLVEHPYEYVGPALLAGALIAVVGAGVRGLRGGWAPALLAELIVMTLWLQHRLGGGDRLGGWLPTPGGITRTFDQVRAGAGQVNHYAAPVGAVHEQAPVYLLALSILMMIGLDLIAGGLRRAPWAGLPLIVALTVPISVLDDGLPPGAFVATGLLYVVLLATAEAERLQTWGQSGRRDSVADGSTIVVTGLKIGTVTVLSALFLPLLVPLGSGILDGPKHGNGSGGGGASNRVSLVNPLVDLQRDLVQNSHLPLLDVTTDAPDPSYLRLSVLDSFNGTGWQPAPRDPTTDGRAAGRLPEPAGVAPGTPGSTTTWNLITSRDFHTLWLPTPYSPRTIDIDHGDWRYSPGTMDISSADLDPPLGIGYSISAFTPTVDADALADAPAAPPAVAGPMTELPGIDPRVTQLADEVTASGFTAYDKAVLLQNWFRRAGGFTYSLDQRPGSGPEQLLRFITIDKVGYCEQFAAAMAVMARAIGIPARVVVGFLRPNAIGGNRYRYTTDNLHAWPEIYFAGSGWVRFEPTPSSRSGTAPPWTTTQAQDPGSAGPTAIPTKARPSRSPDPAPPGAASRTGTNGDGPSTGLILLVVALATTLAAATPVLARRGRRRRRMHPHADPRVHVAALWEELRATALDLGIAWPEGRSVREIARAITVQCAPGHDRAVALEDLVRLVERVRYEREPAIEEQELEAARSSVVVISALMRSSVTPSRARRATALPRSVFVRADRADDQPLASVR